MRTIIAGMRDYQNYTVVCAAMEACGWTPTQVVSGCAAGVDSLGERWAKEHGISVQQFPADWKTHGRAAGPIRNRQMAEYGDALVALWDGQSKGTGNMIKQARERGLRVYVHSITPPSASGS
jgi:hypothetical protein